MARIGSLAMLAVLVALGSGCRRTRAQRFAASDFAAPPGSGASVVPGPPADDPPPIHEPPPDPSTLPPGPALCPPAACGPAPAYPSWACPDGIHTGGRGPCLKLADGTCRWAHFECPPSAAPPPGTRPCTVAECGAPPAVRRWACPDGVEIGSFGACVRPTDGPSLGRCGRVHRPCPTAPPDPAAAPAPGALSRGGR